MPDRKKAISPSPGSRAGHPPPADHIPVLYTEVLEWLCPPSPPARSARYIDGTVGAGGHAWGILEASSPDGQLLGLDADPTALALARERLAEFGDRVHLVHANFGSLATVAHGFGAVDGILFDLGLSSMQLADASRGFSFQEPSTSRPPDMRFDPTASGQPTAADLINTLPVEELADILWRYGEERYSRRIARAIVARRPIATTQELIAVTHQAVGSHPSGSPARIDPATRTFQALRIATNDELRTLERALPQAVDLLRPGGRLAVISFHSLEDRIVKHFLRESARDCICPPEVPVCVCDHEPTLKVLTKKPITPSADEVASNPRSRSAKLRVAERL